jgi:Ca-activated chloride channel family protein
MNPDDPKLTAYALGELTPAERSAVEAELQDNPACRQAVEEIRQAAGELSAKLAAEPCPALRPDQRAEIKAQLEPTNIFQLPRQRWFASAGLAAIAASVMAVIGWQILSSGNAQPPRSIAKTDTVHSVTQPVQNSAAPTPTPAMTSVNPTPAPAITTPQAALVGGGTVLASDPNSVTVSVPPAQPAKRGIEPSTVATAEPTPVFNAALNTAPAISTTTPPANTQVADSLVKKREEINNQNYSSSGTLSEADATRARESAAQVVAGTTLAANAPQQDKLASSMKVASMDTVAAPANAADASNTRFGWDYSQNQQQSGRRGGAGGRGGAAFGGGGGAGGGGGFSGGGGRATLYARNSVVVTETRTTTVYPGDPIRESFNSWRYYAYPSPLPPPPSIQAYSPYADNAFSRVLNEPLSTFSVDVDTASYANIRRFLNSGQMPPRDAVRVEEMVNYFKYRYPAPKGEDPFAATIEVAGCPWEPEHRLVRVGIKAREIARDKRPPSNFVFLIDISGSMSPSERLPLIKQALRQLVEKMSDKDRVAIVVYASEAGVRLPSTPCSEKEKILAAIDSLAAGGSTNGGDGIQQAYRVAKENYIEGGVNRVLLATDGDFNVGVTDQNELIRMIQERAKSGVYLSTLGVGTDNYKDALMQRLADRGNGNYNYLDTLEEAQRVLIDQMSGTLVTVAKDVKIQVEFNPVQVNGYRLIGYEKRALRNEDFNNDAKDAGEIGAGHTVTALYEVVPAGKEIRPAVDALKYTTPEATAEPQRVVGTHSKELLTLKLRYKHPEGDTSRVLEFPVTDGGATFGKASEDFKFAAAVASFGMLLRDSEHKGSANYSTILELAGSSKGSEDAGYRDEFVTLVKKAQTLSDRRPLR